MKKFYEMDIKMYLKAEKNQISFEQYNQIIDYKKIIIVFDTDTDLHDAKILEYVFRLIFKERKILTQVNFVGTCVTLEIRGVNISVNEIRKTINVFLKEMKIDLLQKLVNIANRDIDKLFDNHIISYVYKYSPEIIHCRYNTRQIVQLDDKKIVSKLVLCMQNADYYLFSYFTTENRAYENLKMEEAKFELIKSYIDNPIKTLNPNLRKPKIDIYDNYTNFIITLPDDYMLFYDYYSLINYILGLSSTNILLNEFRWNRTWTYKAYSSYMYNNGIIVGEITSKKSMFNIDYKDFWEIINNSLNDLSESKIFLYKKEKEILDRVKNTAIDNNVQHLFRKMTCINSGNSYENQFSVVSAT